MASNLGTGPQVRGRLRRHQRHDGRARRMATYRGRMVSWDEAVMNISCGWPPPAMPWTPPRPSSLMPQATIPRPYLA